MIGQQLVTILASDWSRARAGARYLSLIGQAINQPAVICYTSGTTANPKGALLSQARIHCNNTALLKLLTLSTYVQDNVTWTCASAVATYNLKEGEEEMISYLPVSHIVAQVMIVMMMMMMIIMMIVTHHASDC